VTSSDPPFLDVDVGSRKQWEVGAVDAGGGCPACKGCGGYPCGGGDAVG
jgi:hypothetical protein